MSLEVIWPRHKWDYLSVPDPDVPPDPPPLISTWTDPALSRAPAVSTPEVPRMRRRARRNGAGKRSDTSGDLTALQGRALAVHAFLQGAHCGTRRVGALFGISLRTVGRDRQQPPVTTAPILERAQTLIASSAERGSSLEERAAAAAWLTESRASSPPIEAPTSPAPQPAATPDTASLTRDQMDACGRLHRRIRIRTDVIRRLLEPEMQRDDLIELVLELLGEIRGATEALETLLQDTCPLRTPAA